jgi:hypothetical protein
MDASRRHTREPDQEGDADEFVVECLAVEWRAVLAERFAVIRCYDQRQAVDQTLVRCSSPQLVDRLAAAGDLPDVALERRAVGTGGIVRFMWIHEVRKQEQWSGRMAPHPLDQRLEHRIG